MIKVSVSSRSKESKRIPQKCVQEICSLLWIRVANVTQLYVSFFFFFFNCVFIKLVRNITIYT